MAQQRREFRSQATRPERALPFEYETRPPAARARWGTPRGSTGRRSRLAVKIVGLVLLVLVVAAAGVFFVNTPPLWFIAAALVAVQAVWALRRS